MKFKTIIIIILCVSNLSLSAQQWINCTSGHHVNETIQDGNTLWIATTGGLVERDLSSGGDTFYNRGNSLIPSNNVRELTLDNDSNIWVSTDLGTGYFDGTDWTLFYEKSGLLNKGIDGRVIIVEADSLHFWDGQSFESIETPETNYYSMRDVVVDPSSGDVWTSFYTFGQYGLYRYDGQEINFLSINNAPLPFESSTENPLLFDNENRLWIGTSSGLLRYDNGEWFNFSEEVGDFPAGSISALGLHPEDGDVYAIVTESISNFDTKLIKIIDDNTIVEIGLPEDITQFTPYNLLAFTESDDLSILVGTARSGLWEFKESAWFKVPTNQSPSQANSINQIFVDGTRTYINGGRNYLYEPNVMFFIEEGDWSYFTENNSPFSSEGTYSAYFIERWNDTLWAHTGDTLMAYANGEWTVPLMPDIEDDVLEINSLIHFEPDGKRWLLEKWESYIFYESDQGWLTFDHDEHGAVSGLYEGFLNHPATGDFWLASANGISHYDGTSWELIEPMDLGLQSNWTYDIEIDADGVIWASTRQGIIRIENNIPEVFVTEIPNYTRGYFREIKFDSQGHMWVGAWDVLLRFDGLDWTIFDNKNSGLPNGWIDQLEFDADGNLWIGSYFGGFAVYNENGLPDEFLEELHVGNEELLLDNEGFKIYPNPIAENGTLSIEISEQFQINMDTQLFIYNSIGQLVSNYKLENRLEQIPLNLNTKGIYFLQLKNRNNSFVGKLMVH